MQSFTIKDLENLSGIKAHTIRIWEQRYSFLKPSRTETNIRYYGNPELKKLLNIALLNKYGYKISHINKMNEAEISEKLLSLNQVEAQQERIINELIHHMVEMENGKFEAVLNSHILSRGMEKTISQIIFPFMEKIGILWLTNHINPAQEHIVSNIIRQKLMAGIDQLIPAFRVDKTILLFLPEGEFHELGLLFMQYMLKTRGVPVIYLGANSPMKEVEAVVKCRKPDYIYIHITSPGNKFNFERFLTGVCHSAPSIPIVISGQYATKSQLKIPSRVSIRSTSAEIMEFIYGL